MTLSHAAFDAVYQRNVTAAMPLVTSEMQEQIGKHCYDWRPGRFDFESYLRLSSRRFYECYRALGQGQDLPRRICDIAGFWGVFPVTLKQLGFPSVAMTETLAYYGPAFDTLFDHIRGEGVEILDLDPFAPRTDHSGAFDFISALAVLEHYPHSPADFMENAKRMLAPSGHLYVEVPNVAHILRRISLLLGHSPLSSIESIYLSATPFTGHHHEYTRAELRRLAELSGMPIVAEYAFNYSGILRNSWKLALVAPLTLAANALAPTTRECLGILLGKV